MRILLKKHTLFLLLSLLFYVSLILILHFSNSNTNYSYSFSKFDKSFLKYSEELDSKTQSIFESIIRDKNYIDLYTMDIENNFSEKGMIFLIYDYDTLRFWSDNSCPIPNIYNENVFSQKIHHFDNGWFYVSSLQFENFKIIGLLLIKNDFPYQNDYLINNYNSVFDLPSSTSIALKKSEFNIFSKSDNFLFSISFEKNPTHSFPKNTTFFLYFLSIIFFLLFAYYLLKTFNYFSLNPLFLLILFSCFLVLFRIFLFYFKYPISFFDIELFSPKIFASSSYLPSLGDFLINSIFLLFFSYLFFKTKFSIKLFAARKNFFSLFNSLIFIIISFSFLHIIIYFSNCLILNSTISFSLINILSISFNSIIGFLILGILFLSFFLLSFKLISHSFILISKRKQEILFIFLLLLLCLISILTIKSIVPSILFFLTYLLFIYLFQKRSNNNISSISIFVFIILNTIFITFLLHNVNNLKEQKKRIRLAEKLVPKRDYFSEYLFQNIQQKINSDTTLFNLAMNNDSEDNIDQLISDYLLKKYFNNYFNKFNILLTVCDYDKILSVQPDNFLINCDTFFNDLITNYGIETEVENLFYQKDFSSNRNYIGIIKFPETQKSIFIEFFSKYIPKGLGYPELLIDKSFVLSPDLSAYSYAKYFDGILFYKFGKFLYSIDISKYQSSLNNSYFFDLENYNHYFHQVDDSLVLIISKGNSTFLDVISPFSYLLVFYILFILIFLLITNYSKINIFSSISLRNRIQVSIISIIFLSFIAVGFTSLFYLIKLNNDKNYDILSEKSHSVLIELEHKLANEEVLNDELKPFLTELLYKFSLVFFSDINIYNTNGELLATSRPEIFDNGLISEQMNSQAYFKLNYDQKLLYIHKENISNQEYLSAYLPFRNENNKIIAYLNLPYFAKQTELQSDIFTFLVAFFNIYVILIAFSIFIALIISRHITKPLQTIREKLSSLNLTKVNEKIIWNKNDEIGNLILEYNRMIDELAESANLLAKSEREGAWRNMAKQVAHEIKNPLTPMKLSVQYLEKAWNDDAPDFPVRLKRFSATLTEQIDTLSQIATEFSDFAKMPISDNEKIDISQIIYSSILLFSDYPNITIHFKPETDKKFIINADKKQILRVFNNLLKNSVQALRQIENGEINISIKSSSENIIVTISDNGIGIPKNQFDKIFTPSFTTKSYGMGIGLAIVKSIINNSGGEIYFESVVDFGTTFTISFPIPKS